MPAGHNVTGTVGNDLIRPASGTDVPGYTTLNQYTTGFDDIVDASQGGNDYIVAAGGDDYVQIGPGNDYVDGGAGNDFVLASGAGADSLYGGGGNDVFFMGATVVGIVGNAPTSDVFDGGSGFDQIFIDGNYAGLELGSATFAGIEWLTLLEDGSNAYNLTLDAGLNGGAALTIDGSSLTTAPLTIDASAVTSQLIFSVGASQTAITGGTSDNTFYFNNAWQSDATVSGGSAARNTVWFENAAAQTIALDRAHFGDVNVLHFNTGAYDAVAAADLMAADKTLRLYAPNAASLDFSTASGFAANVSALGSQGDDTIRAGDGADTLNGGAGADRLAGGGGNDLYRVDDATDRTIEAAAGGTDTVFASVGYALQNGQSIELLATTSRLGTTAISFTGNELGQRIDGNYGVNGLYGGAGDDTLYGFDGNDRLGGGEGRDLMDGGNGADTFAYSAVTQSTGVNRDLIQYVDWAQDRIDLPVIPTALDATVTTGSLSDTSFDADLASAIDATRLGAYHAVLFDPSAGTDNAKHHVYLIIDANGDAGYQAGQDYVFELLSPAGTLALADFI